MAFVGGLINDYEKVVSSNKHTQFNTKVLKPYPIQDQNGQNRYPIYDQTLPFGAVHTYTAYIREYPSTPIRDSAKGKVTKSNVHVYFPGKENSKLKCSCFHRETKISLEKAVEYHTLY